MKKIHLNSILLCFFLFLSCIPAIGIIPDATSSKVKQKAIELPWAVFGYWGRMTNDTYADVVKGNYTLSEETLYSLEFSRVLSPENLFRRFLQPAVSTVELNLNFTYRDDPMGSIYEVVPYFSVRWGYFPWDKYLPTTIAVGEGVSIASKMPTVESDGSSSETNQILNYLMLELTLALPKHPNVELVIRTHHRSGVFGLYSETLVGSTAIGLGLRYRF